jgi:hypothetical protein
MDGIKVRNDGDIFVMRREVISHLGSMDFFIGE